MLREEELQSCPADPAQSAWTAKAPNSVPDRLLNRGGSEEINRHLSVRRRKLSSLEAEQTMKEQVKR